MNDSFDDAFSDVDDQPISAKQLAKSFTIKKQPKKALPDAAIEQSLEKVREFSLQQGVRSDVPVKRRAKTKTFTLYDDEMAIIETLRAAYLGSPTVSGNISASDIVRAALHHIQTMDTNEAIPYLTRFRAKG